MSATPEGAVRYRMERAQQSLAEADLLAEGIFWNGCANRVYYACFYAVTALMMHDGSSMSKHTGVRGFLNRQYVRTGRIEHDLRPFPIPVYLVRCPTCYCVPPLPWQPPQRWGRTEMGKCSAAVGSMTIISQIPIPAMCV